ncbi:MAG: hypothetical protein AVDCRST_MAG39-1232, partial [uncultured Sphingomonadaceae bacterium]
GPPGAADSRARRAPPAGPRRSPPPPYRARRRGWTRTRAGRAADTGRRRRKRHPAVRRAPCPASSCPRLWNRGGRWRAAARSRPALRVRRRSAPGTRRLLVTICDNFAPRPGQGRDSRDPNGTAARGRRSARLDERIEHQESAHRRRRGERPAGPRLPRRPAHGRGSRGARRRL